MGGGHGPYPPGPPGGRGPPGPSGLPGGHGAPGRPFSPVRPGRLRQLHGKVGLSKALATENSEHAFSRCWDRQSPSHSTSRTQSVSRRRSGMIPQVARFGIPLAIGDAHIGLGKWMRYCTSRGSLAEAQFWSRCAQVSAVSRRDGMPARWCSMGHARQVPWMEGAPNPRTFTQRSCSAITHPVSGLCLSVCLSVSLSPLVRLRTYPQSHPIFSHAPRACAATTTPRQNSLDTHNYPSHGTAHDSKHAPSQTHGLRVIAKTSCPAPHLPTVTSDLLTRA